MKRDPMPLGIAIPLFIIGLFLGSIFTFGMYYWNAEIAREECAEIHTGFIAYSDIRSYKHPARTKEIMIACANNANYDIDGVSITSSLLDKLSMLDEHEQITLLIHPNSNTILEFSTETETIIRFEDTIEKLGKEKIGFLFLGLFMYFCAGLSLYYILPQIAQMKRKH